jgi:hypothetical protein
MMGFVHSGPSGGKSSLRLTLSLAVWPKSGGDSIPKGAPESLTRRHTDRSRVHRSPAQDYTAFAVRFANRDRHAVPPLLDTVTGKLIRDRRLHGLSRFDIAPCAGGISNVALGDAAAVKRGGVLRV